MKYSHFVLHSFFQQISDKNTGRTVILDMCYDKKVTAAHEGNTKRPI